MDIDLKEYLLSHSLEGIVITDLEGDILACNQTACRLLGYQELELLEQFVGFIFPPQSVTHLLPNLLHLTLDPTGFEGDIILQNSLGDGIMVRMVAQAWPRPYPSCLVLRFLDWRETHEVISQLRKANQLASLGILTRSLSHEIINPVTVIGGHTRRLLGSLIPDSGEDQWAKEILTGVEKLESMVETIRNFLDLPTPSFSKGSLDDLMESSLNRIREDALKMGVQITRTEERKIPEIYLDPELLEKAFSAVLLNALDRMPRGGQLNLDLDSDNKHCSICVEDNGPSLDARQMEEDLSPIHVIGAHQTHLNLAIAKRIVDEHGGEFDIGRSDFNGLKVKIRLPIDRRALAREREM